MVIKNINIMEEVLKFNKERNKLPKQFADKAERLGSIVGTILKDQPSGTDTEATHKWLEEITTYYASCTEMVAMLETFAAAADLIELRAIASGTGSLTKEVWNDSKRSGSLMQKLLEGCSPDIYYYLRLFKGYIESISNAGWNYRTILKTEREHQAFDRQGIKNTY